MPQKNSDIEEYVEDTLMRHLESGSLSVGNSTIILTIQDALLENAHGMFLWVAFQIESICSQKTDEAILSALEDLPKDLPETFNRILQKLELSTAADPRISGKIFDLVAAAQRPLTLEELREAVSVNPGEKSWDASKLINDMFRTLLDSCGSLVTVDEEGLTVHFTHHSVKQHLLSKPMDSDVRKYHLNMRAADLYFGKIVVTYLSFGIFDRQITKTKSPMISQVENYPSAILHASLPGSNIANRLAMRLLKNRERSKIDIPGQLQKAAEGFNEQAPPVHHFLPYARKYWLFHTKLFTPAVAGYNLWQRLVVEEFERAESPWTSESDLGDEYIKWILQNEHWALIQRILDEIAVLPGLPRAIKLLVKFIEDKATIPQDVMHPGAALYVASCLNNQAVALLSLKEGAKIDDDVGYYGPALQAASHYGRKRMVVFLLEYGANVNIKGGYYGTALQAVSYTGNNVIARLLLDNGADPTAVSGRYSTALKAASVGGYPEVVQILLNYGADVNEESGEYGTALQAASQSGRESVVRVLLQNRATVNATSGRHGTALYAASKKGYEPIARLLLQCGAEADDRAMEAALESGNAEVKKLMRNFSTAKEKR